jgi:hypothetical protein
VFQLPLLHTLVEERAGVRRFLLPFEFHGEEARFKSPDATQLLD